jgi:hypothetical protein
MPGLVLGIHVFASYQCSKTWMAGTSPGMTAGVCSPRHCHGKPSQIKPEQLGHSAKPKPKLKPKPNAYRSAMVLSLSSRASIAWRRS